MEFLESRCHVFQAFVLKTVPLFSFLKYFCLIFILFKNQSNKSPSVPSSNSKKSLQWKLADTHCPLPLFCLGSFWNKGLSHCIPVLTSKEVM